MGIVSAVRMRGWLTALSILLSVATVSVAQEPLTIQDVAYPKIAFAPNPLGPPVTPSRTRLWPDGYAFLPVPSVAESKDTPTAIRAFLRLGFYRYQFTPQIESELPVFRLTFHQDIKHRILPAALRIPEFAEAAAALEGINVDVDRAMTSRVRVFQPQPPYYPAATIKYDVGTYMSLDSLAYVLLQWDNLTLHYAASTTEGRHILINKYVTAMVMVLSSEYSHATSDMRVYDPHILDAAIGSPATENERIRHAFLKGEASTLLLAHETCHVILSHGANDVASKRREESEADVCAAKIFVQIYRDNPLFQNVNRYFFYQKAAHTLALLSVLTWPPEKEVAGPTDRPVSSNNRMSHDTPKIRYDFIMSSVPSSYVAEAPELTEVFSQPPVSFDAAYAARSQTLISDFSIEGESRLWSDLQIFQDLADYAFDVCADDRCFEMLESQNASERYFAIRALVDLAASLVTLAERGVDVEGHTAAAWYITSRVEAFLDAEMPVASSDWARVRRRLSEFG